MALRWRKDPRETGLARICAGPRGHTLYKDGEERVASVNPFRNGWTHEYIGWYWVAFGDGIPRKNTCENPVETEAEAKKEAMTYVKKHLKKIDSN
jgi:hypothetical protein